MLTRRKLLFASSALGLTLLLPRRRGRAATPKPDRFLLHVMAQGGLDTSMLFDARPRAMTAAGLIHNPLGEEPTPWVGDNGQQTLAGSATSVLRPLRDRFSVINGVVMSTTFDGHDQNTNVFLAGNPFGGTSFNADVNLDAVAPLDYIRLGGLLATLQDNKTIQITPPALADLVAGVTTLDRLSPALDEFLGGEAAALGDPSTRFGAGVLALDSATTASRELKDRIEAIQLGDEVEPLAARLSVVREVFRHGIARGAVLSVDDIQFDNHSPQQALAQGPSYVELCSRIARVFQYLAATAFDDTRSLLDVTTVVIGSEFGRTMRQLANPIDNTGTDHNPLSSTVLLGGAGIRGGLVIGASDFQAAGETLSGAHLALDPDAVKTMGRPFDFAAGAPSADRPAEVAIGDYLQIGSIVNTVYSLFDVAADRWRLVERNGEVAPILTAVLA